MAAGAELSPADAEELLWRWLGLRLSIIEMRDDIDWRRNHYDEHYWVTMRQFNAELNAVEAELLAAGLIRPRRKRRRA